MKDKKLHGIMKHSNEVTKAFVDKYNMTNAREIAKINQVTDLLLSIKDNERLFVLMSSAIDFALETINELKHYNKNK